MTTISPTQFDEQPLFLKATYAGAVNDHTVYCAGRLVGRIMQSPLTDGAESWL